MFKKLTLLAMAIGALAAFALPAVASANWTVEGEELTENHTLEVTGTIGFMGPAGAGSPGVSCIVTASIELTAGTNVAHVKTFAPEVKENGTPNCTGTGVLANCHVESVTAIGLPWTLSAAGDTLTIQGAGVTNKYKAGTCPITESVVADTGEKDSVTAKADNQEAVSEFTMGGTLGGGVLVINGNLKVIGGDAGKYGF